MKELNLNEIAEVSGGTRPLQPMTTAEILAIMEAMRKYRENHSKPPSYEGGSDGS